MPGVVLGGLLATVMRTGGDAAIAVAVVVGSSGGVGSLVVHELGHARAARHVGGVAVRKIVVSPLGAATHLEGAYARGRAQLLVAAAGPAASLALAAALAVVAALGLPAVLSLSILLLALMNVAVALVSLIPIRPLDGYKILLGLAWMIHGSEDHAAKALSAWGGRAFAAAIVGVVGLAAAEPAIACCAAAVLAVVRVETWAKVGVRRARRRPVVLSPSLENG